MDDFAEKYRQYFTFVPEGKDTMPITVGNIVDALEALGGEAHYSDITAQVLKVAQAPFPADPAASVRARLQERCSDYKAYKHRQDLFESDAGTGIWRFRQWRKASPQPSQLKEELDVRRQNIWH